jgi:hypothetical protein
MRWFFFPDSKPLSLSAHSMLRSLYAHDQKHHGQGIEKAIFRLNIDFTPDEFAPAFDELKNKGYAVEALGLVVITAGGRNRCKNVSMSLKTQRLQRPRWMP